MNYLATVYLPGALAVWCAVLFALASVWGYSQVLRGDATALAFARRAYRCFALSIGLVSLVLIVALLRRDFRLEYVYQYSGLDLDWHFQFASFWAGQKGSFLIWLFWGTMLGLPLLKMAGKHEASVMGIYLLTQLGILFILVRESPFLMLPQAPPDGQGLNPLLQDNWMVIHPPIMFIGYAASAVPFAFAMASLWRRDYDGWAARAFPWALVGFCVLGTAILMGGYWAYKTLGWGGYWGWDPVENASLIPWLLGVVLVHGLHMERTKGRYRRANYVLAALVYLSVLYGTFLTRSGVLADFSVHSFVDLGISGWLIALMGFFVAMAVVLLALRLREVPTAPTEDPFLSRGSFMVLGTIAVLASALVVTIGTSAPLLTRFLANPGQVGPSFYNRVNLPIALLVAFLLALVPFLTWRSAPSAAQMWPKIWPSLIGALLATAGAVLLAVRNPFHLVFLFLCALALGTNLHKTISKARAGGLASAGGYLTHVGVGIILIGILASSAYDESSKVTLEQGKQQTVGDLQLTFNRFIPRVGREKERMEVEVVRANGSRYLAYPRLFLNDRTQQLMANPHIRKYPGMDLYISPIEYDPGEPGGEVARFELGKGQSRQLGDLRVEFLGFDMSRTDLHGTAMASNEPISVGAVLAVDRRGANDKIVPVFRFRADGRTESPGTSLPGGGEVAVAGINASDGAVQLVLAGIDGAAAGRPAKLSLDITRKPLINLVWYGLYVIMAGGLLALVQRVRELRLRDRLEAERSA